MTKLNSLSFEKIEDFDRNKLTGYTYNCPWNNDPQYTHLWNDLNYLKTGGVARCGQPETRSCVHRVEYSIAGFRNTCPIAGRCGTYATPAPLRFSQFDFKGRNVTGKIELNKVNFSFKHKNNGVDVANGREAKTWGGKFSKVKVVLLRYDNRKKTILDSQIIEKGPSINQYRTISVNFNLDKIAKGIASQTQRKTFNNNRTLDLKEKDNFAIELHYYRVENTNPSVIRLKNPDIDVEFTYIINDTQPSINIDYDSNIINCSSKQVVHTVQTNHDMKAFNNLTYKEIPAGFSKPTVYTNASNYTKTYVWTYNKNLTDTRRTITYETKAGTFKTEEKTIVKIYQNRLEQVIKALTDSTKVDKPIYTITNVIKGSAYSDKTTYVAFKNLKKSASLCYDKINLHIKHPDQREFIFTYTGDNKTYQCYNSNNQKSTGLNRCFYEQVINKLKCGKAKVTAEFIVNGKPIQTIHLPSINVRSVPYSFTSTAMVKITDKTGNSIEKELSDPKHIRQISLDDEDNTYEYFISFKRDDPYKNYPAPIVESIYNETNNADPITARYEDHSLFYDENSINFKININEIGRFKVGFYYRDACKDTQHHVFHEFTVVPRHDQKYDELYIQEMDNDYQYESIVIREGDNNRVPIAITDIDEINSYDKIKICFNGGKTSISEMGFGQLEITNKNDFVIKNLAIELNPLVKNEETGEYDWINLWDTIFEDFEHNIFNYNTNIKGRVQVINNGEDVYLKFLELEPNDPILINIPFISKNECTYYMSLFINGIRLKRKPINANKLLPYLERNCSESDYAKFVVTDTMLLDLKINNYDEYINIDDYEFKYDNNCNLICYNNECNQCGPFTVLYAITNIDSISPISGEPYFIKIDHSPELEHIIDFDGAYELNEDIEEVQYPLPHTYVDIIINPKSDYEDEEPITYTIKTDENGEGVFYYTIPSTELRNYNTKSLYAYNRFNIFYKGNDINNPYSFQNPENIDYDEKKLNTLILVDEDFSQYKPGESIPIHFQLSYMKKPYDNGIYVNLNEEPFVEDFKAGRTILLPVTYKGVKKNPNQVLNTSIETISDTLTNNYVEKQIYCNIDTQVKIEASLAKTLVQQNDSNTLNILVKNGLKPNQRVKVKIITRGYKITNVNNITNGTYSIGSTNLNKSANLMYWNIGDMESYEKDKISINLQAQNDTTGQKDICIKAFDYLHIEGESNE